MGWAEDQLKKYLNQIMPSLRCIPVLQMLDYFPYLTDIDKETIRANVDREGNKQSVWIFLNTIYARERWVDCLIKALRDSNMEDLATDIESVYMSYQIPTSVRSTPAAAKATSCVPATCASAAPSSNVPLVSPPCNTPSSNDLLPPPSSSSSQAALKLPLPSEREAPGERSTYRDPIQESEGLSSSSEEGAVRPEAGGAAAKKELSSPPESNPAATNSGLAPGEKKPYYDYCDNVHVQEVPPATSSELDQLAPKWDGRQQHPVCVKNGYFGNLPGDSSALSASAASLPLGTSPNQPEEDDYVSSDHHPSVAVGQDRRTLLPLPDGSSPDGSRLPPSARPSKPPASSTSPDVTPPRSSPPVSVAPNDDLKPSVQEKKLSSGRQDDTTSPGPAKREVIGSIPHGGTQPLDVRNVNTARGSENRPPWPSRDSRIIYSNRDADGELCKPGILSMTPKDAGSGLDDGQPGSSEPETAYSGESDRLAISSSFSLGSDPILLSDLSQSNQPEESFSSSSVDILQGRNVRNGTGNAPPSQPLQGSRGDNGSIRTHTIRVEEPPSVDLNEAPRVIRTMNRTSLRSSASLPDLATGCQPGKDDRSYQKDSWGSCSDEKGDDDIYRWLFLGVALAAVMVGAFVLFKKK